MIEDALQRIALFRGRSLATTLAAIEGQIVGSTANSIGSLNRGQHVDGQLLAAAQEVKEASAQIDVILHAIGMLLSLPYVLAEGERVEVSSIGAGNAKSAFDLVTNMQVAEFKFSSWQGGSESIRKKSFFEDYYKLVREQTAKAKRLYLLGTEIPLRFLMGRSRAHRMLDKNKSLADDFQHNHNESITVGEYHRQHLDEVELVDLTKMVPEFRDGGPLVFEKAT